MKKIVYAAISLFIVLMSACTYENVEPGVAGRDGRDGLNGLDGKDGQEAFLFEYDLDFIAPDYREVLAFPDDFEMLDTDVALVYLLWEVTDGKEIWRLMPQSVFMTEGLLTYNFDYTTTDVAVFMEANYPLSLVPSNFVEGWTARVVVVPGQFNSRSSNGTVDYKDYNAVIERYNLKSKNTHYKDIKRAL